MTQKPLTTQRFLLPLPCLAMEQMLAISLLERTEKRSRCHLSKNLKLGPFLLHLSDCVLYQPLLGIFWAVLWRVCCLLSYTCSSPPQAVELQQGCFHSLRVLCLHIELRQMIEKCPLGTIRKLKNSADYSCLDLVFSSFAGLTFISRSVEFVCLFYIIHR